MRCDDTAAGSGLPAAGYFDTPAGDDDDLLATMETFEDTESFAEVDRLYHDADWPGLVRFYRRRVREDPEDPARALGLGEAYLLARDFAAAVEHLATAHRRWPRLRALTEMLLDALFQCGAAPTDVAWVEQPAILDVDGAVERTLDLFAGGRGGGRTGPLALYDLLQRLAGSGYLWFHAEALVEALANEPKLRVDRDRSSGWYRTWISAA